MYYYIFYYYYFWVILYHGDTLTQWIIIAAIYLYFGERVFFLCLNEFFFFYFYYAQESWTFEQKCLHFWCPLLAVTGFAICIFFTYVHTRSISLAYNVLSDNQRLSVVHDYRNDISRIDFTVCATIILNQVSWNSH